MELIIPTNIIYTLNQLLTDVSRCLSQLYNA